jgi:Zn-dependent M16 (insulinase) family peptidase
LLTREDIEKKIEPLTNEEHELQGVKVVHHNVYTNKIAYLRLLFHIKEVPKELLPYASLLSYVIGYVDTENYSYLDLSNEVNIHTGGISTNVRSFSIKGNLGQYYPVFEFPAKVLYVNLSEAFRSLRNASSHEAFRYQEIKGNRR